MSLSLDDLAEGVAAGRRPALARALSLAERDPVAVEGLLARLAEKRGGAHVVGITGPPGAGKSALVGAMLQRFLQVGQRVAVLAVDPSSPVSGGALLGDRFRMGEAASDERSFIRSTATRGSLGGLTNAAGQMVALMDAAGFDLVMVETVGTGQSEIDIARLADSLLVVFPPGLGDEMQAIKAGILELADLLVVTKSDTAAASQATQALRAMAPLWRREPPIHSVSSVTGEGIVALAEAVLDRVRTSALSVRRADSVMHMSQASWSDQVIKLRSGLGSLPEHLIADMSMQILGADRNPPLSSLQVVCSVTPRGDLFQLGAVAGAANVLAADMNLSCRVTDLDLASGRMCLLLERTH